MRICTVDIETSGLDPAVHDVIEVGICGINTDPKQDEAQWAKETFSLGFDLSKADPKAMEVNHWYDRANALTLPPLYEDNRAARAMTSWFTDSLVIASPAHFDIGFLTAWYNSRHFPTPWHYRSIIDVKSLACGRFGFLNALGNKDIAALLDVEDTSNHTAQQDAVFTMELVVKLMGLQS